MQKSNEQLGTSHGTRLQLSAELDFPNLCFICGENASDEYIRQQSRYPKDKQKTVRTVTNSDIRQKTLEKCRILNNKLAVEVSARVERVNDLLEVGARYHYHCKKSLFKVGVTSPVEKKRHCKSR